MSEAVGGEDGAVDGEADGEWTRNGQGGSAEGVSSQSQSQGEQLAQTEKREGLPDPDLPTRPAPGVSFPRLSSTLTSTTTYSILQPDHEDMFPSLNSHTVCILSLTSLCFHSQVVTVNGMLCGAQRCLCHHSLTRIYI